MASLHDVYRVLADGSRELQNVQKLPWEGMANFGNILKRVRQMGDFLEEVVVTEVRDKTDLNVPWPALSSLTLDIAMVRI